MATSLRTEGPVEKNHVLGRRNTGCGAPQNTARQITVSQMLGHPDSDSGFNKLEPGAIYFPDMGELSSLWRRG